MCLQSHLLFCFFFLIIILYLPTPHKEMSINYYLLLLKDIFYLYFFLLNYLCCIHYLQLTELIYTCLL